MLNRYLGNKTTLLGPILEELADCTPVGGRVGDLFAGTMSVSMALKAAGYDVVANDINLFSTTTGAAFVANNKIPEIYVQDLIPSNQIESMESLAFKKLQRFRGTKGYLFLNEPQLAKAYLAHVAVLAWLEVATDDNLPPHYRHRFFFDTYTEEGSRSEFTSLRGQVGRRRFFSSENGHRIDIIANHLRWWLRDGLISRVSYQLLCTVFIRAVEKISNTQGTYHDFPRCFIDGRALNPLVLTPPAFDDVLKGGRHLVGDAEDSLEFAKCLPPLDCVYLDPPYNFRQYTAYYFMPNLLCRYGDIEDLESYFSEVRFVRGQNPNDDFSSTFCRTSTFLRDMECLIDRTPTKYVILSYFNGKNHWNDFKKEPNGIGLKLFQEFFSGKMFVEGSQRIRPVPRMNYQSYGGYVARQVDEYLFIARKKKCPGTKSLQEAHSETG